MALLIGDRVRKVSGDYIFEGTVVAVFRKLGGASRIVVEDKRGILLIMNESQVEVMNEIDADRIGEEISRCAL